MSTGAPHAIRFFVKSGCGWCDEARDWLDARGLKYAELNVSRSRTLFDEMIELSGQTRAPVIEVEGRVLADFGADELEAWWTKNFGDG
ncbi:MAG: glutaredoxin family protein [Limisphaerales bacterium]